MFYRPWYNYFASQCTKCTKCAKCAEKCKWTDVNGFIVEVNNLRRRELHVEHNQKERKSRVRVERVAAEGRVGSGGVGGTWLFLFAGTEMNAGW